MLPLSLAREGVLSMNPCSSVPFLLLNGEHPISDSNAACVKIPRDHLSQEFLPSEKARPGQGFVDDTAQVPSVLLVSKCCPPLSCGELQSVISRIF